jgi:uncharacterized protein (DUF2141 family)
MKILLSIVMLGVSAALGFEKSGPDLHSLTVKVQDLRNSTGSVQFTIYNTDGSIPDDKFEKYHKQLATKIQNNAAFVVFKDLPSGVYAVNVLHDENENGAIDKGWVLPIEGVGFSNFQTVGLFNRPNFNKAKFELNEDKTVEVKMIYM